MSPKEKIIKIYTEFLKAKKMSPSRADMLSRGITRDMIKHHFGSITKLKDLIRDTTPEAFKDIVDDTVFTPKAINSLRKEVKKYKRFVVTTAVTGMPVHMGFYNNLKFYCEKNDAKLLILLSSDPAAMGGFELDGVLAGESFVFDDVALNDSLFISTFKTSAKQVNPLTGIARIGQRERSMIIASPKQFLEYVPIANDKASHALMTTGALTLPMYKTERYMSQRTAYISESDHCMGAIIVEIEDNKYFHVRQVQAEHKSGYFIDLGKYYLINRVETVRPEAIVFGDWHTGSTDPIVRATSFQMLKDLKPKRLFLHDVFDGISINPHMSNAYLTKAGMGDQLSLGKELLKNAEELTAIEKAGKDVKEILIVASNHDDFLSRYLQSGEYIKDAQNSLLAHELALGKAKGKNPFEEGVKLFGFKGKRTKWLKISDSYKICGIEHGSHGHQGLNGQKNPPNSSLEKAYGIGVFGHSHSPGILRGIYRTGTSTYMRLGYNQGSSSWGNAHVITYSNGSRQLVGIFNGKYKLK